jgi:hypothetical protein
MHFVVICCLGSGASLGLLLPLMWRLGGVLLHGLWRQQLLQLAWLLCCNNQQVGTTLLRTVAFVSVVFQQEQHQFTDCSLVPEQENQTGEAFCSLA